MPKMIINNNPKSIIMHNNNNPNDLKKKMKRKKLTNIIGKNGKISKCFFKDKLLIAEQPLTG